MALLFEPFFSRDMWLTNAALTYYFGNAEFEMELGAAFQAAPQFVKDNVVDPVMSAILTTIMFVVGFYNAAVFFIMAMPSNLCGFVVYWDARFLFLYRWLTLTWF